MNYAQQYEPYSYNWWETMLNVAMKENILATARSGPK